MFYTFKRIRDTPFSMVLRLQVQLLRKWGGSTPGKGKKLLPSENPDWLWALPSLLSDGYLSCFSGVENRKHAAEHCFYLVVY